MFKVYGTTMCGYCKRATALLQERGYNYSYRSLDNDVKMLEILKEQYNWKTVPMIVFIEEDNDESELFIGGFTDLFEYLKNEESPV